ASCIAGVEAWALLIDSQGDETAIDLSVIQAEVNTTYTIGVSGGDLVLTDNDGTTVSTIALATLVEDVAGEKWTYTPAGGGTAVEIINTTNASFSVNPAGELVLTDSQGDETAIDLSVIQAEVNTTYTIGVSGGDLVLTDNDGTTVSTIAQRKSAHVNAGHVRTSTPAGGGT